MKNTDQSSKQIELSPNQLKLVAIHESAHAVAIKLLQNYLQVSQVAIVIEKTIDGYRLGTNRVSGKSGNIPAQTAVAMAVLAGVVGEYIHQNGIEKTIANKDAILENPKLLDWHWAGGDCEIFLNTANGLANFFQIDIIKLKKYCISFLIDFLANKVSWQIIESLSEKLLAARDLTLTEQELNDFYTRNGYDKIVEAKSDEILTILNGMKQACDRDSFVFAEDTEVNIFDNKGKDIGSLDDDNECEEGGSEGSIEKM